MMKALIVEDDETSRSLLQQLLAVYGEAHVASNGKEAVESFRCAMQEKQPYDLVCLDIMLPDMDGHGVLRIIRAMEKSWGVKEPDSAKVIMTTALADRDNVTKAGQERCDAYIVKPILKEKLVGKLEELGILEEEAS